MTPIVQPRNTKGTHCRRFFSMVEWDYAEMIAGHRTALRTPYSLPRHRAEKA